ncbi:unnamed protein product [Cylicocyclus nassatus]|uniref:Uncharacterized protein n=1 Tax=Cylicocyclus nassatus TaxID=53992 RepID=A0AA36M7P6_CYLNA|nr:unnamed protein product [Cylicocyclus nassatus]
MTHKGPSHATAPNAVWYSKLDQQVALFGSVTGTAANITGIAAIANGGTGASTAKAAEYNLLKPTVSTDAIGDDSEVAFKYVNPTNTNGVVYARKASLLWNYIKGKLSGTDVNIGGNAATASAAKAGSALESAINAKQDDISDMIPTAASASNPLCDKAYADAIGERLEARFITADASGSPFATHADLVAATSYYYHGSTATPDNNDITLVMADEDHLNAADQPSTTRYRYNGVDSEGKPVWSFEYVVNPTALNYDQLMAINSTITAAKVATYDGYETGKQDKLTEMTEDEVSAIIGELKGIADRAYKDRAGNIIDETYSNVGHKHLNYNDIVSDESTSDVTDMTEILTSYADNFGYSESHPETYRRRGSSFWNYIKGKLSGTDVNIGGSAAKAKALGVYKVSSSSGYPNLDDAMSSGYSQFHIVDKGTSSDVTECG